MTRSLTNIWRGDLLRSFRYHPLGILLFAVCVGCVTLGCLDILAPRFRTVTARIRSAFMQARILIGFATLMILVWVARLAMAVLGMHYFSW